MTLAENLEAIYRRWARRTPDALPKWCDVWFEAFELAHFVVGDRDLAMATAYDAVTALDEQRATRRHRRLNTKSYHSGQGDGSTLRKPALADDQQLDLLVLYHSTNYERIKQERQDASRDDLDVWFVKCVIEHCYALNGRLQSAAALHLAVAVSAVLHDFDVDDEVPRIWGELTTVVPRAHEIHAEGSERYRAYLLRLNRAIKRRFSDLILDQGRGGFQRRRPDVPARDLTAQCFNRFELRGTRKHCLTLKPHAGDDGTAEITRLHVLTHFECYDLILQRLPLPRKDRATLAEFNIANVGRPGDSDRRPAPLSPSERREVEDTLRDRLYKRKRANLASLIVTVEDDMESLDWRELDGFGTTSIVLPESSRVLRIWAAQEDRHRVLIASRLLSTFASMADVDLVDGRTISFQLTEARERVTCQIQVAAAAGVLTTVGDAIGAFFAALLDGRAFRPLSAMAATAILVAVAFWVVQDRRGGALVGPQDGAGVVQDRAASVDRPNRASSDGVPASSRALSTPQSVRTNRPSETSHHLDAPTVPAGVQNVYVGRFTIYGDEQLDRRARQAAIEAVTHNRHFRLATSPERADVVVDVDAEFRTANMSPVQFRVSTRTGQFLSTSPFVQVSAERSKGGIARDSEVLARALVAALESARPGHRRSNE